MNAKKSVYIAYTGGTIGMKKTAGGYQPAPGFLADQMSKVLMPHGDELPSYEINEYEPLLDSSNMTPRDWVKLGADIMSRYADFDGFIVLHGTDTMAYSASALSFMFENLGKPIVFTGSQIPLEEIRTDARENLITSLLLAGNAELPEVCVFVGNRLLRGNRTTKVSADHFRAFDSPNYPPLGDAGVYLDIHRERLRSVPTGEVRFHEVGTAQIVEIRVFPGLATAILERLLQPPLQGAVLRTYGLGNAPDDPSFLAVLHDAAERGVVLVNCSQCLEGAVNMNDYATGRALQEAGVISGYDMTPEAALTKLYFLLSLETDVAEVRRKMQENLCGELTRSAS